MKTKIAALFLLCSSLANAQTITKGVQYQTQLTKPCAANTSCMWTDPTTKQVQFFDGTTAKTVPSVVASLKGDLAAFTGAIWQVFHVGSNGKALIADSTQATGLNWSANPVGTVTSISAGTGIVCTPDPIVTTGSVALANTAVTPGTYTDLNGTVDQQGRITAASISRSRYFWSASKTWTQIWAEVVAGSPVGAPYGTILVEPTAFPGLSITTGAYDFTNIRFQGMDESSATAFGSTISFDSGAMVDGGTYAALRGDAVVFSVTTALMTPGAKRVVVELTGNSRLFRNGDNVVFNSSATTSVFKLIDSSIAGNGVANPFFFINVASNGVTLLMNQPLSGNALPTRVFGGIAGSAVAAVMSPFTARSINSTSIQAPTVWAAGGAGVVAPSWTTAQRPVMVSGFGKGALGYNTELGSYDDWNGTQWVTFPSTVNTALQTTAYAAKAWERVLCNPTAAGFTVTLPTAALIPSVSITVKNASASTNTITVATTGGQTIDGAATNTLTAAWQVRTYLSDGTNWLVLSN